MTSDEIYRSFMLDVGLVHYVTPLEKKVSALIKVARHYKKVYGKHKNMNKDHLALLGKFIDPKSRSALIEFLDTVPQSLAVIGILTEDTVESLNNKVESICGKQDAKVQAI